MRNQPVRSTKARFPPNTRFFAPATRLQARPTAKKARPFFIHLRRASRRRRASSVCYSPPMDIRVVAAERSDLEVLRHLVQLYVYDLSDLLLLDVDDTGRFREIPLAAYWTDSWRLPFLIRADERLAGFALVHEKSRLSGGNDVWDMAEFFVLRRYRRAGVGTRVAHRIFAEHPGKWEVRERSANTPATAFWRRAISAFTNGRFTEEVLDDERWRGPVQSFTSIG